MDADPFRRKRRITDLALSPGRKKPPLRFAAGRGYLLNLSYLTFAAYALFSFSSLSFFLRSRTRSVRIAYADAKDTPNHSTM